jgi:hypothetical protein
MADDCVSVAQGSRQALKLSGGDTSIVDTSDHCKDISGTEGDGEANVQDLLQLLASYQISTSGVIDDSGINQDGRK